MVEETCRARKSGHRLGVHGGFSEIATSFYSFEEGRGQVREKKYAQGSIALSCSPHKQRGANEADTCQCFCDSTPLTIPERNGTLFIVQQQLGAYISKGQWVTE